MQRTDRKWTPELVYLLADEDTWADVSHFPIYGRSSKIECTVIRELARLRIKLVYCVDHAHCQVREVVLEETVHILCGIEVSRCKDSPFIRVVTNVACVAQLNRCDEKER